MIDRKHETDSNESDYLNKYFMGIVEDVADPRKEGRCKVRIFGIHEDLPTADLPWAYPTPKSMIFGAGGKSGSISIPKLNSVVAIRFNGGNIYAPEYFAIHELADDIKEEAQSEYEGSHFILFDGDQELKIWFTLNKGLTIQLKGASININQENLITVKTDNKVVVDSPQIELGAGATESVILGDAFKVLFDTHTHADLTPPLVPLNPAVLSKITKTK
jgi:hypothetical protein